MAQAGDESGCLPVPAGHPAGQAHAAPAAAVAACHVGLGPGLVDEDQPFGVKRRLILAPLLARSCHVRSVSPEKVNHERL